MPSENSTQYTKPEIIKIANKIREKYFRSLNPREGFNNLFTQLKGKVEVSSGSSVETLNVAEDGSFTIKIPQDTSHLRDAFTIGHELGHYFLHTDLTKDGTAIFNRRGSSLREREANWFAAELLMPCEQFKKVASELQFDPVRIAMHFGVSGAAARVRLSVLGLI